MNWNRAAAVWVAILFAITIGFLGFSFATADYIHTYRIDFTTAPGSDEALRRWVEAQPGVRRAWIDRDGTAVVVAFTTKTWSPSKTAMPVEGAMELGYKGLKGYSHRRSTKLW